MFPAPIPRATRPPRARCSSSDKLIDFIQRNYESDAAGRWFFQNGPQRVYVELEATPLVWRIGPAPSFAVAAHTGTPARTQRCIVDEAGRVYLETDLGFGLVHTQDMTHAADAVEQGLWVPEEYPPVICRGALGMCAARRHSRKSRRPSPFDICGRHKKAGQ